MPMEAFIKIYLYRTDLFNDPEIKEAFKARDRQGPDAGQDPRRLHRRSPSSSPSGARTTMGIDLWGTTAQAHTGHPASWYEFFEVGRADLRRLQLGHQRRRELRRHRRAMAAR